MEAVGMAPKLIVAEEEGRIEEFLVNFKAASSQELRSPQIMQSIAQTLARFHLETVSVISRLHLARGCWLPLVMEHI